MSSKIMIVDDEHDVAHMAAKRLRSRGYEVTFCYEGKEAITAIRTHTPDLILLDIWLPEVSGIDIFKTLRTDAELKNIPIVFFSADPSKEALCLQELGSEGFVKKPYNHLELLQVIEGILVRKEC